MTKVIHIEICKSFYKDGKFNIRIGDILGCSETSNSTKEDILKDISNCIDELKEKDNSK